MELHPTPYPDLNAVLDTLVQRVQDTLGSSFVAACLQGSVAVGDFDEHSDVDFPMVGEGAVNEEQVRALQEVHAAVYDLDCGWAKHL